MFMFQLTEDGVLGKMLENVLYHVEEVYRDKHVPVRVQNLTVMVLHVTERMNVMYHVMKTAVQVNH